MKTNIGEVNNRYAQERKEIKRQELFNNIMNSIIALLVAFLIATLIAWFSIK